MIRSWRESRNGSNSRRQEAIICSCLPVPASCHRCTSLWWTSALVATCSHRGVSWSADRMVVGVSGRQPARTASNRWLVPPS